MAIVRLQKFNENHDELGRFAESDSSGGAGKPASSGASSGAAHAASNSGISLGEQAKTKLDNFAKQHIDATIEHALVVLPDGGHVLSGLGNENSVSFTKQDMEAMTDKNVVFVHNHPNGGTLSTTDLLLASKMNALEMRAVGKSFITGDKLTYLVQRIADKWPSHEDLMTSIKQNRTALHNQYPVYTSWGKDVSIPEADSMFAAALMSAITKDFSGQLKYSVIKHE